MRDVLSEWALHSESADTGIFLQTSATCDRRGTSQACRPFLLWSGVPTWPRILWSQSCWQKLESQNLLEVLPPCEERRKLRNKVVACEIALSFLHSGDEARERRGVQTSRLSRAPEHFRTVELIL